MEVITSSNNPKVKAFAALKEKKYREQTGLYLVEGVFGVAEYIHAGAQLEAVLFDSFGANFDQIVSLVQECEEQGVRAYELSAQLLARVSDTEHPQGVIAVVRMPRFDAMSVLSLDGSQSQAWRDCRDVIVIADGVRDPGNLGTMIRSADAVGARAVVVTAGSADPFAPKVVRSSAGSLARLPVLSLDALTMLSILADTGYRLLAMEAHHGQSVFATDLLGPLAIVIGGEASGISEQVKLAAHQAVSLPMPGLTESLNAGVTSAVMLYEALRQRLA